MNEDNFIALVEAVEAAGGELIPETHVGEEIKYVYKDKRGRKVVNTTTTAACNSEMLVELPYEPVIYERNAEGRITDVKDVGAPEPARFCLWDDRMDLWPRFAEAVA